jgi:hypothetical protein
MASVRHAYPAGSAHRPWRILRALDLILVPLLAHALLWAVVIFVGAVIWDSLKQQANWWRKFFGQIRPETQSIREKNSLN